MLLFILLEYLLKICFTAYILNQRMAPHISTPTILVDPLCHIYCNSTNTVWNAQTFNIDIVFICYFELYIQKGRARS